MAILESMEHFIFQVQMVSMPEAAEINTVMRHVISFFGGSHWGIADPSGQNAAPGREKLIAYSEQNLADVCARRAPEIGRNGRHDYSIALGNTDMGISVNFERVRWDYAGLKNILRAGGAGINALHIHFAAESAPSGLAQLMMEISTALKALYGRVFMPRYAVKRSVGRFEVFGGLPGLHPIMFLGIPILNHLRVGDITALRGVSVEEVAEGALVNFIGRTKEFTHEELAALEPAFGERTFRKFDARKDMPTQIHLLRSLYWLIEEAIRYRRDSVVFDCDLRPLIIGCPTDCTSFALLKNNSRG